MESPGHVITKSRKGWTVLPILLTCFLIFYWWNKTKNEMTTTASVKGILYDAGSGEPVADAIIMITGGTYEHPDMASQSGNDGVFYLPNLKLPGKYTLQINVEGQSKTIETNIENKDNVLKIPF